MTLKFADDFDPNDYERTKNYLIGEMEMAFAPLVGETQSGEAREAIATAAHGIIESLAGAYALQIKVMAEQSNNPPTEIAKGFLTGTVSMPRAIAEELGLRAAPDGPGA